MTWIQTLNYQQAGARLKKLYDRVRGQDGHIDNIMLAHALRPASLQGHMTLYKNVLHHTDNQLDKWLLECLGLYVSLLNGCDYCADHHHAGMARLLGDPARAAALRSALSERRPERVLAGAELALMHYAERLTLTPAAVDEADYRALCQAGLDDGRILEANQVIAYFAYANRTVLGLGVTTDGEPLGLSPNNSDDEGDWVHS